jgi:hypothetical protein
MRLTLRTLLAYLDGILEPADAEDLAKKIPESEYAAALVHRIHDVMRRLRLGAPSLSDRGPGLDPNTVAEYLDNTLASERVTDFEKVCLDSDVHLAEVAASHQILTLVLGEPAEVDPASRRRMYLIKDAQSHAGPPPTPAAVAASSSAAMPGERKAPQLDLEGDDRQRPQPRPKPAVPEYLREPRPRRRWWVAAAAVVLVLCITGVILMALGQFESDAPLGKWIARLSGGTAEQPVDSQGESPNTGNGQQEQAPTEPPPAEPRPPMQETPPPEAVVPPGPQDETAPPAPSVPPSPPGGEQPPPVVPPVPPAPPTNTEPIQPPPAAPPATPPATQPPAIVEPPSAKPPEVQPPPDAPPPPAMPEPLGRLMSNEQQILLALDPTSSWTRVSPNQMLLPQQLLVPPTYRAKIALTSGVTMEALGGTRFELLASGPREPAGLRIYYGRVVLMPLGKNGLRLRLAFGDHDGTLTFADAESIVALTVSRLRAPGADPETGAARIVADLFVTTGGATWEESEASGGGKPLALLPPQRLNFDAQLTLAPVDAQETPAWIVAEPLSAMDRRASPAIAQALGGDRLARVGLLELATSRPQKEVKWLALRCLAYLGQFGDMVAALNDPARKLDWQDYVDQLRAAVGRDAETAAAVRMALEKQYPQQAANLYRMLWGYSDKDLQGGEDLKLVQALDDDLLAVRVLGYWNLKEITGLGAAYSPEQPAARRQMAVRRWRQRLDAKEIRLKTPEEKAAAAAGEKPAPEPPAPAEEKSP